jgi:hypothetical protein
MNVYNANSAPLLDRKRDGIVFIPNAVNRQIISDLRRITDSEYDLLANPNSDMTRDIAASSASWGGIAIDHVKCLASDPEKATALVEPRRSRMASN